MNVVIVGCGRVGAGLAASLDALGHAVAIIDRDADALQRRIGTGFGGRLVVGSGFDRDVLEAAGAVGADGFVAVTSGDNTNIVAARIARETFHIPNVVARIYDPGRAALYERLGIPTIATVPWTTDQIMRRLLPVGTPPLWSDALGEVDLRKVPAPRSWAGRRYRSLGTPDTFSIVAVTRDATTTLVTDEEICQEDDVVFIMVRAAAREELARGLEAEDQS